MVQPAFAYPGSELEVLAGADNYYRWIHRHFAPHLGRTTIEVGAGVGTFASLLLAQQTVERLLLVEPAVNLFPLLRAKFAQEPRVSLFHGDVEALPLTTSADCTVLVNVMEHVADVPAFLGAIHRRMTPAGRLLVFVPAGPALFGSLDRAFGHHRRYTRATLTRSLEDAGFRVESLRYLNLTGVVPWFIAGKLLRKTTLSRRDVRFYDRWVVPWLAALESIFPPPFGQSLVAITGKRPGATG